MQCREKTARGKVLEIALRLLCKTYSTDTAACRDERCALLRNTSWGTVSIVAVRGETAGGQTDIVSPVATLPLLCTALALCALCTVPHSPCSALATVVLHTICSELDSALYCDTLSALFYTSCVLGCLCYTVVPHVHYICRSLGTCRSSLWTICTSFLEYLALF